MSDTSSVTEVVSTTPVKTVVKKKSAPKKNTVTLSKAAETSIKDGIKKFSKIIEMAVSRNLNESDTSNIINDLL